jgi:hypothetical protein
LWRDATFTNAIANEFAPQFACKIQLSGIERGKLIFSGMSNMNCGSIANEFAPTVLVGANSFAIIIDRPHGGLLQKIA